MDRTLEELILAAGQGDADAQCELGSIRQASQGQFSIEPLNDNTPYIKKVRVVTTVDYFLE